jgi:hypothetical protein
MTAGHGVTGSAPTPGWARTIEWLFGVLAVVSVVAGLVILFGGDDQSVGFWGGASWRVGDISAVWGYGLVAGGAVVLVAVLSAALRQRR